MTALFAEEPLPVTPRVSVAPQSGHVAVYPHSAHFDQRRETADVQEKHGVLALVVRLPEEAHRGREENPRRPSLFLRGSVLTPKNEGSRHVGRVLDF